MGASDALECKNPPVWHMSPHVHVLKSLLSRMQRNEATATATLVSELAYVPSLIAVQDVRPTAINRGPLTPSGSP